MIINDLDGYYIVFDTKNWNTELDTLVIKLIFSCKKNTFVHSAKSCHYAATLSTEAPILSLPSDILSFPG